MNPKVAVVTGASRGLGAALAADLAARGYSLGLCATTEPVVDGAMCRSVDVADAGAVDGFAAEVAGALGLIDLWINNAAVLGPIGPVRKSTPEQWQRCIDVNVQGVVNGIRSFLIRRSDEATLVNIASRVVVNPAPGIAAYSATKAAVVALTISLAEEEKDSGLRAYAVLPPSVDTQMQDTLLGQDVIDFPQVHLSRQRQREGGVLSPEDAAARILDAVLADPEAPTVIDLTASRM